MKKLILLLLFIPLVSFGQVTTFNEIDNINGIQDFQRTLIEEGYSLYDSSQFFGSEDEGDKWKVYVFNPIGEGEEIRGFYIAGMSNEDGLFDEEGIKSIMFFAFANDVLFPIAGQYYDTMSSYIKNTYKFAEITEDVYAWYNSTENPKVQYGIGKAEGFGWIIKKVLE